MGKQRDTQVLIVGGGTTGTAVARELSKYKVDVVLVEKEFDVAGGQTKCSGGIVYSVTGLTWAGSLVIKSIVHEPGLSLVHPESLKERLTAEGFGVFESLARELDLSSFRRCSSLMIAVSDEEMQSLNLIHELCRQIAFEPQRLDREAILAIEPHVTDKVICGLLDTTSEFLVYPWEYCIALAENARENGISILTGCDIQAIQPLGGGFRVETNRGPMCAEFIVNAAGASADRVAQMAGVCDFGLKFMKGQTEILDKRLKEVLNCSIHSVPRAGGGGRIVPLPSGNLSVGFLEYFPTEDRLDLATRREWSQQSLNRAHQLVPGISERDIITSFAGMRVFNNRDPEDHIIEPAKKHPHFINAVIRLPSIAASPAIAKYVVSILGNQGLELVEKADFKPERKGIPIISALTDEQRQETIDQDPRYGRIVCRCEEVSEGEIVEAIRRGARTVAGVKYRTRAGMGRCQGGFCGARVVEILARELDIPMTEVTQKGGLSRVLLHRSKELLN